MSGYQAKFISLSYLSKRVKEKVFVTTYWNIFRSQTSQQAGSTPAMLGRSHSAKNPTTCILSFIMHIGNVDNSL